MSLHACESQSNLWELVCFLYQVGSRDHTQVVCLGSKPLYLLGHLYSSKEVTNHEFFLCTGQQE